MSPRPSSVAIVIGSLIVGGSVTAVARTRTPSETPAEPVTYFIADGLRESGFREGDRSLAEWAIEAWAELADPALEVRAAPEETAAIRIYWVRATDGLYGETRVRIVDGRPAADVFVRPDLIGLGPDIEEAARVDPLFRDTVVYLTCVHEIGHAFGLPHTRGFADIMYSFQYGGDFVAYFGRFRDRLGTRDDIRTVPPFSPADGEALRATLR